MNADEIRKELLRTQAATKAVSGALLEMSMTLLKDNIAVFGQYAVFHTQIQVMSFCDVTPPKEAINPYLLWHIEQARAISKKLDPAAVMNTVELAKSRGVPVNMDYYDTFKDALQRYTNAAIDIINAWDMLYPEGEGHKATEDAVDVLLRQMKRGEQ